MGQHFVPRRDHRFPVKLSALYMSEEYVGQAAVTNLSLTGWRLTGTYPVERGVKLSLRVTLADEERPMQIPEAVVQWTRGNEFGIELGVLPAATQERIREWVCSMAQDAYVMG